MKSLSRRELLNAVAASAVALQVPELMGRAAEAQNPPTGNEWDLRWLEGEAPPQIPGVTWGIPWPRGKYQPAQQFRLVSEDNQPLSVQSWPTAYWPDGSLKWTAHAMGAQSKPAKRFRIEPADAADAPANPLTITEEDSQIVIENELIRATVNKSGTNLIESIQRKGKPVVESAHLVLLTQNSTDEQAAHAPRVFTFTSDIEKVTVESSGPVRAVVKIEGKHSGIGGGSPAARRWLPFVVRLYFYAGSDQVRIMHTFIFDGNEQHDFIRGLGVRISVPMNDAMHDRHVRLCGQGSEMFAEGIRTVTGLRRDPGEAVRTAQAQGLPTPPLDQWAASVRDRLELIPAWGDFTLTQSSADGFQIRKRTKPGCGWISAGAGNRASGVGYIGGISGGAALGMRDFWQRCPSQIDIRKAASEKAELTLWLWSPDAPAMDLRFYHDGMGMDSHPEEIEGLNITYEDYEKDFGTPVGVARTTELNLWAVGPTPARETLADFAAAVRTPPLLVCSPQRYLDCRVFGALWTLPDRSTPSKAKIEDVLNASVDYYRKQVEQHRWYGFWDYGDVMHSYDPDRHCWRYDVGGYAWANSELSPDLWLWYSFLRSGDAGTFRLAEAMTRHTGEVDVYHLGRFAMLGSRHNVQHWGCSAKQVRISTAAYRRIFYFLTADERVGDLMHELVDADQTFLTLDPIRKIRQGSYEPRPDALAVGFGTDWGSLAAAWLAEWERTGNAKVREKLINGMKTIGAMPNGFFTSGATYDLATGKFTPPKEASGVGFSHLSAVFGLPEIVAELLYLVDDVPEFEKAWLQYCRLSNLGPAERAREIGGDTTRSSLVDAHSRLTAYAAWKLKDPEMAKRAWGEFLGRRGGLDSVVEFWKPRIVQGPDSLHRLTEIPHAGTNGTSQWALAAMQNLALIGDALEEN